MKIQGNIGKMRSEFSPESNSGVVEYRMPVGSDQIYMNELVGRDISLTYGGKINCIYCGRETKKSFAQGYCYPCFISLPQTDECILHPEKCRAHDGISRDMVWSEQNCLEDHFVYLALTPGLKVGVTRHTQIPTRWIDQGAWKAIRVVRTPNRYTAGMVEVHLKDYVADKTNWRQMLAGKRIDGIDLIWEKKRVKKYLTGSMIDYFIDEDEIIELNYPVLEYPDKVTTLNLDTDPFVSGKLAGIKGQYLIFSNGSVLNIRKFGGYLVDLETEEL
ncbi:MAG TPA: DUF2797 domain-containing protein [Bacteroidales bacterium]|nr:DUF2797 domain-containing protein [Bacteroidales bacterium]